jgi:hypothetical protein
MQCPKCKGAGGWSQRTPGPMYVKCPTCGGSGVLYTQAEMQAKDRKIEMLNKITRKLVSEISKLWPRVYFSIEKCDYCAFHEISNDCLDRCNEPNKDCERGIIEWVRRQVEEDAGK